jgi:hypothetical protein
MVEQKIRKEFEMKKTAQNILFNVCWLCLLSALLSSCWKATENAAHKAVASPLSAGTAMPEDKPSRRLAVNHEAASPDGTTVSTATARAPVKTIAHKTASRPAKTAAADLDKVTTPAKTGAAPMARAPNKPDASADQFTQADHAFASMGIANIAFNTPQKINIRETFPVHLHLSLTKSLEELQREIAAFGPTDSARVPAANRMEAILIGDKESFDVTEITAREQAIGTSNTVEWQWEVKPKLAGRHNLHLTLTPVFVVNGATVRKSKTFDRTIEVDITLGQMAQDFVSARWQWLWAAILVPIGGQLWRRRAAKKDAPSAANTT